LSNKHPRSTLDNPGGLTVVVRGTDERSYGKALKRFKKIVKDSDLLKEIEKNRFYEKTSLRKKRERAIAVKRQQKATEKYIEQFGF